MNERIIREGSLIDYLTVLPEAVVINGWGDIAHGILRWYNRESGSWVVSYCDLKRHQVGDSTYVGNGAEAAKEIVRGLYHVATATQPEAFLDVWD